MLSFFLCLPFVQWTILPWNLAFGEHLVFCSSGPCLAVPRMSGRWVGAYHELGGGRGFRKFLCVVQISPGKGSPLETDCWYLLQYNHFQNNPVPSFFTSFSIMCPCRMLTSRPLALDIPPGENCHHEPL